MDFVALDIETADSANSAPCSIGIALVINGKIAENVDYLINPETNFNPIAIRIHKITPEMVETAPTFPQIWGTLSHYISNYPVVAHNANFDMNVLKKAAARYQLSLPDIKYYCTMEIAKHNLTLNKYTLADVCNAFDIPLEKHHCPKCDAAACAQIMLTFIEKGYQLSSESDPGLTNVQDAFENLSDFECQCLNVVAKIVIKSGLPTELVRFKKPGSLFIDCYYRVIEIGTVRKKPFIGIREKYLPLVNCDLEHDETKKFVRFFLSSPNDLEYFAEYVTTIISKSISDFNEYKQMVTEKTVQKHMNEYRQRTHPFVEFPI